MNENGNKQTEDYNNQTDYENYQTEDEGNETERECLESTVTMAEFHWDEDPLAQLEEITQPRARTYLHILTSK